jgi:3-hydroxymyristoyl/3-hydroxydecanoyl-(acyl carrier protein) dehydratase
VIHETTLTVPPDHPAFAGHFPGQPILPGVVLLGWVARALEGITGRPALPCEIGAAKFLRPVGPGAVLTIRHSEQAQGVWRFEVLGAAGPVASGTLRSAAPIPLDSQELPQ